jgi:hypothetical protein
VKARRGVLPPHVPTRKSLNCQGQYVSPPFPTWPTNSKYDIMEICTKHGEDTDGWSKHSVRGSSRVYTARTARLPGRAARSGKSSTWRRYIGLARACLMQGSFNAVSIEPLSILANWEMPSGTGGPKSKFGILQAGREKKGSSSCQV